MLPLDFLLESPEPWVVYNTLIHLINIDPRSARALAAREAMIAHPLIQGLVAELQNWPGEVLSSHKSAGQHYHKLAFLADIGMTATDPGLSKVITAVKAHPSKEGVFQLPIVIPVHFGGSGEKEQAWALCDAPLLLYTLKKLQGREDEDLKAGLDHLKHLARSNGWPCAVSESLGKFRGPGRKDDPCPVATLLMLKLLGEFEAYAATDAIRIGTDCILNCWENSLEKHPYMFFMGSDFRKLKAPFIWYDILHVTDVLSRFQHVHQDPRFLEMVAIIRSKANEQGLFTPESEWKAWKGWDFAQKKKPSAGLTFLVYRLLNRLEPQR